MGEYDKMVSTQIFQKDKESELFSQQGRKSFGNKWNVMVWYKWSEWVCRRVTQDWLNAWLLIRQPSDYYQSPSPTFYVRDDHSLRNCREIKRARYSVDKKEKSFPKTWDVVVCYSAVSGKLAINGSSWNTLYHSRFIQYLTRLIRQPREPLFHILLGLVSEDDW